MIHTNSNNKTQQAILFCKTISLLGFLVMLIFMLSQPVTATTYYVDQNHSIANDTNPGTEAQPWLTIQKAADTLIAGDTVFIKTGTYNEQVMPRNSGIDGNYIVYIAYPGDAVTIDGTGIGIWWNGLFQIAGKNYIKVSGLRIINSTWGGVVSRDNNHIVVENCYFAHLYACGLMCYEMSNIIVDGNELYDTNTGLDNEGISLINTDTFEVKNNYIHDTHKEGIDAKVGSSNGSIHHNRVYNTAAVGIYIDGWDTLSHDIDVYCNIVASNRQAISLNAEKGGNLQNIRVYNNILYSSWHGLSIYNSAASFTNITIINNTFWRLTPGNVIQIVVDDNKFTNLIIKNNIFDNSTGTGAGIYFPNYVAADVSLDNNLFYNASGVYGTDYVLDNPDLANLPH